MGIPIEAPRTDADKAKILKSTLKSIEGAHGDGSIVQLGARVGKPIPSLSTGLYSLDYEAIGTGGIPLGRIAEIYGPEAGGKTTLALKLVAAAQRAGKFAAYIDAEHALDPTWAYKQGVDVGKLVVSQPDSGEQALKIAEELISSGIFGVVVIDSVAALVPQAELEGEIGDANVGMQARLMSQACRMLYGITGKTGTVLVFINQIREKIGVMFGSPETTSGGRALKFYASIRLDVRRISSIKKGDVIVGNNVRIKVAKNKVSAPFRETFIPLMFDKGFDANIDLFDSAVRAGVIEKSGAWFAMNGEKLGQGREASLASIIEANLLGKVETELHKRRNAATETDEKTTI